MTVQQRPSTGNQIPRRVVLVVEDEVFVREATCHILQSIGFDVLPAADALEAMKAYESHGRKIDLLMTDVSLPGRSGRELADDVRITSAEIPILLTSGYLEPECNSEPHKPRTYFLPKPYTRADLIEMMDKILSGVLLRRAATQTN